MKTPIAPNSSDTLEGSNPKSPSSGKKGFAFGAAGAILATILVLITLEIVRRNLIPFVVIQQRYILSVETALLGLALTETFARLVSVNRKTRVLAEFNARLRLGIRVTGYSFVLITVISILSANPTLGISTGAVAGLVIAFATQNVIGNVLAAIFIFNTKLINIGEEISVSGITGRVIDIRVSHTLVEMENEIAYVPNSLLITSIVRRKKETVTRR